MDIVGLKVIVAGAGIGGLAVACALAQRGADVRVLEQADAIREVGAGLQISPNGYAVLRALGLDAALRARSVQAQSVALHDYRKGEVLRLDLSRLADRNYHFIHRADLIETLHGGAVAAGARVLLLQRVAGVHPGEGEGGRPVLSTASGARMEADLIIGADGLHSVLRPVLNGVATPFFTGQVAWRATMPNVTGRGPEARVHMGPLRHLVSYPLRGGELLNVVAVQERAAWTPESWSQKDDPMALRAAFQDFGAEAQDMLSGISDVSLWGLFRHPVAQVWGQSGVALLGDAAHPTLPFMAQGACMALEDAWVLADAVAASGRVETAVKLYQARRIDRVRKVVDAASRNAWKYHLSTPPLRWAAHQALRLGGAMVPDRMLRQFDWIYGLDVTGGALSPSSP